MSIGRNAVTFGSTRNQRSAHFQAGSQPLPKHKFKNHSELDAWHAGGSGTLGKSRKDQGRVTGATLFAGFRSNLYVFMLRYFVFFFSLAYKHEEGGF